MTTLNTLVTALEQRLGTSTVWSTQEKLAYITSAVEGLYPAFYRRRVDVTLADDGPEQTAPPGARNIYKLGLQREGSTRVRKLRGWAEGEGSAYVPKTGIAGETLVWAWTEGWTAPSDPDVTLSIPPESKDVVVIKAHISALEKLLTDRVSRERYLNINAREMTTDEEVVSAIDMLNLNLRERLERVAPLPEVDQ